MADVSHLPVEMLAHVFSFITEPAARRHLRLTCKHFRNIASPSRLDVRRLIDTVYDEAAPMRSRLDALGLLYHCGGDDTAYEVMWYLLCSESFSQFLRIHVATTYFDYLGTTAVMLAPVLTTTQSTETAPFGHCTVCRISPRCSTSDPSRTKRRVHCAPRCSTINGTAPIVCLA